MKVKYICIVIILLCLINLFNYNKNTMKVNYVFVRHGQGCHNAIGPLYKNGIISINKDEYIDMVDPTLTDMGIDASLNNGCIINNIVKNLYKTDKSIDINYINVVGCSPLIRCMETAYYMTRNWVSPPSKIFVFPYLREIDEMGVDKYSKESRKVMDTNPSYMMKTMLEQKEYLKNEGILESFDFSYIEKHIKEREEPGDIIDFAKWFSILVLPKYSNVKKLNVFITTHAGVLSDFAKERFTNNSGFVLSTSVSRFKYVVIDNYISLNKLLPDTFFDEYNTSKYLKAEYYCPSKRCEQICKFMKDTKKPLTRIKITKCIDE